MLLLTEYHEQGCLHDFLAKNALEIEEMVSENKKFSGQKFFSKGTYYVCV